MEALRDAIVAGKAPHAGNLLGPVAEGLGEGPRPLFGPAAVEGFELAAETNTIGGIGYVAAIGGSRIYYKNQDAESSEQAIDAISNNLAAMTQKYKKIINDAKAAGFGP